MRFLDSNLNRGRTIPIKIQFLGHDLRFTQSVSPLVQHARLDASGDAGRLSCASAVWEFGWHCEIGEKNGSESCSRVTGCS